MFLKEPLRVPLWWQSTFFIYKLFLRTENAEFPQRDQTHSEQSGKLKSSSERHLQLSGGRQVQSAPDHQTHTVTVVLHTDRRKTQVSLTRSDSWKFLGLPEMKSE